MLLQAKTFYIQSQFLECLDVLGRVDMEKMRKVAYRYIILNLYQLLNIQAYFILNCKSVIHVSIAY